MPPRHGWRERRAAPRSVTRAVTRPQEGGRDGTPTNSTSHPVISEDVFPFLNMPLAPHIHSIF